MVETVVWGEYNLGRFQFMTEWSWFTRAKFPKKLSPGKANAVARKKPIEQRYAGGGIQPPVH